MYYYFGLIFSSGTQDGTQESIDTFVINLIRHNPKINAKEISETLGISVRTVRRKLKEMDNVKYIGHGYSGHWEIQE